MLVLCGARKVRVWPYRSVVWIFFDGGHGETPGGRKERKEHLFSLAGVRVPCFGAFCGALIRLNVTDRPCYCSALFSAQTPLYPASALISLGVP